MRIPAIYRALFLIFMLLATGIYFWVVWGSQRMFTAGELISLSTMLIGVLFCIYTMRKGLRNTLSAAMIVLGVYTAVKIISMQGIDNPPTMGVVIGMSALGCVSALLGITIWLGYTYNVFRVMMCMLIFAAGSLILVIIDWHLDPVIEIWWQTAHLYIVICLLSASIVLVTLDPSMELPLIVSGNKDNIVAMRRRMISVDDAYILTSDMESLKAYVGSDSTEPIEVKVRSNDFLPFRLIVVNKGNGEHLLEICDNEEIFMNILHTMRFKQMVCRDDHISFFGEHGYSVRLLVFDEVQENMNLPKIMGRELNIQKKS